jgi:hypothetical protein
MKLLETGVVCFFPTKFKKGLERAKKDEVNQRNFG